MSLAVFTSNEGNTGESHLERFMNYRANFLSVSHSVSWHYNPNKKKKEKNATAGCLRQQFLPLEPHRSNIWQFFN